MIEKLSQKERSRFDICKKQISEGLQTCFDTGTALTEIRDAKLYREDFDTFKAFCQQTYQIGESYAYRLIESAEIKTSPIGEVIENEGQARAIAKVPEKHRPEVLKQAAKTGNITAKSITVAAKPVLKSFQKEAVDAIELDRTGLPIPHDCLPLWNRAAEVQKYLTQLSDMRGTLRKAQEANDLLWGGLNYSGALADLGRTYTGIECAKPYAVCPKCQGRLAKNCVCCKGRGMVSQYLWDSTITREEKAMRAKVVENLQSK